MAVARKSETMKRIKSIRPGYYLYNSKTIKVNSVQRWWIRRNGKREFLGGNIHVDSTKEGSGLFMAKLLDLEPFARHAKRISAPKNVQG